MTGVAAVAVADDAVAALEWVGNLASTSFSQSLPRPRVTSGTVQEGEESAAGRFPQPRPLAGRWHFVVAGGQPGEQFPDPPRFVQTITPGFPPETNTVSLAVPAAVSPPTPRSPRHITALAHPVVPSEVRSLLQVLLAIVRTKAGSCWIPIETVQLVRIEDPDEEWERIAVDLTVRALPAQALALWDSIGRAIDRWRATLPPRAAERLIEDVSLSISWPSDAWEA